MPASCCSRAASCSTPTATSWSRSSTAGSAPSAADLGSNGPDAGIAGVAVVPRTTPDGFKSTLAGGALTIGRGRMYVDGLLAENHGAGPAVFDPLLAEVDGQHGHRRTPRSPTGRRPTPLPTGGTHLVYLDVWQREVTRSRRPTWSSRRSASTPPRARQTVWQVRVHAAGHAGQSTCTTPDADIPGWARLIAPSAGAADRRTRSRSPTPTTRARSRRPAATAAWRTRPTASRSTPAAPPGTATFKWSRDNGSVAGAGRRGRHRRPRSGRPRSARTTCCGSTTGDWVEITDDVREFDQVAGEMRKIEVHDEDGTMSLHAGAAGRSRR